jgi:hypothetical protein
MLSESDTGLHLGFMFASPIVLESNHGGKSEIPQLSFRSEFKICRQAAKESGKAVNLLKAVATQANFTEILARSPKGLHISCHGIKNTPQLGQGKNNGDFLLFENQGWFSTWFLWQRVKANLLEEFSKKLEQNMSSVFGKVPRSWMKQRLYFLGIFTVIFSLVL